MFWNIKCRRLSGILMAIAGLLLPLIAQSQPINDSCAVAQLLTLPTQFNIPLSYQGSNVGATPELPSGHNDCTPGGGIFNGLGADVWYRFDAQIDGCINVELFGLEFPEFNIIENGNCSSGLELVCTSASGGGVASATVEVNAGVSYLVRASSSQQTDQNEFTLSFTLVSCDDEGIPSDNCGVTDLITFDPPPSIGNFYAPGTAVEVCYSVEQYQPLANNWLHAIQIELGEGWDQNSIFYEPIPSCNGLGEWDWYPAWTSCTTGITYGPGFAYESQQGISCGGFPFDGDPGNNYGDGGGNCIFTPPTFREFCWTMNVLPCEDIEDLGAVDLGIDITVLSDGTSGSWQNNFCDDMIDESVNLVTICNSCLLFTGNIEESTACPGEADGHVTITPFVPIQGPVEVEIYTLTDSLLFNFTANTFPFQTPDTLPIGFYGVLVTADWAQQPAYCNNGYIDVIHIQAPFEAKASILQECTPGFAQLLLNTSPLLNGTETYSWTGPDNFSSDDRFPQVTNDGWYYGSVSYEGCTLTDSVFVTIGANIELEVSYWQQPPCEDTPLQLQAIGSYLPTAYEWYTSEGIQLFPTYIEGGDYWDFGPISEDLTLRVVGFNNQLCDGEINFVVDYFEAPPLNYDPQLFDCSSSIVRLFIDDDEGIDQVIWSDTGNDDNPRLFDALVPGQEIALPVVISYNAVSCTYQDTVRFVAPGITLTARDTLLCPGDTTVLYATTAQDYLWSTGATLDSIIVNPPTGQITTYSVTVTDFFGCEQEASIDITKLNLTSAAFSSTNDELDYTFIPDEAEDSDTDYEWTIATDFFTDYSVAYTFPGPGSYPVQLVTTTRCGVDTSATTIVIEPGNIPQVNFTTDDPTSGCGPLTIQYINESQDAESYLWTFPGGTPSTSTEENPVVTYTEPGVYDVQLVATNSVGSNAVIVQFYVEVFAAPPLLYSTSNDCSSDEVVVTIEPSAGLTGFTWSDTGNDQNPRTFGDLVPGEDYSYGLTINYGDGSCSTQETVSITGPGNTPLVVDTDTLCLDEIATLTAGPANSYEWSTGEDTQTIQVSGTTPGNQTIDVVLQDTYGCTYEQSATIVTLDYPLATFTVQTDSLTIALAATDNGYVDSYLWDFGDGNTSNLENPLHTYTQPGNYTITLTVTGECGQTQLQETVDLIINSIDDGIASYDLRIFPNPNQGAFTLTIEDWPINAIAQMQLINTLGQQVYQQKLSLIPGEQRIPIATQLPAGVYFLAVVIEQKSVGLWKVVIE